MHFPERSCVPAISRRFYFEYTPTTKISTLSLHDALPIYVTEAKRDDRKHVSALHRVVDHVSNRLHDLGIGDCAREMIFGQEERSEEHTSELQSQSNLVCRLLLEKKKLRTMGGCKVAYRYT